MSDECDHEWLEDSTYGDMFAGKRRLVCRFCWVVEMEELQ